jgi:photosystem II stability/assembly factor-like uncharacterized protein
MTKMPGEGDIDTQHNRGQVCGKKIMMTPMTTKQTKPTVHTDEIFEMQDLFESERIPNIGVATDGAALAFARTGRLLRRSEDGGQTWSPIQEVGQDAGGSAVIDENSGDVMVVHARAGHLWRSHDPGKTWERETISPKPNAVGHGTPDAVPAQTACSESGVTLLYTE